MMRLFTPIALAIIPIAAYAQDASSPPPPPGIGVETIGLRPGESKSFVLRPGTNHTLLVPAAPTDQGAVTVSYTDQNGRSVVTATSNAGPLTFDVLADPDGDGGYERAGQITAPTAGKMVVQQYNRDLGAITVGDFRPAG
jgi:hypothetical protein